MSDETWTAPGVYPEAEDLEKSNGPRHYFLRSEAVLWSQRTGRPILQWTWDDDLDTRRPEEIAP